MQGKGANGAWWLSQSSKLMRPDSVGLGGFDSHAFPPPARNVRVRLARLVPLVRLLRLVRSFAVALPLIIPATTTTAQSLPRPPISPGKAFIASALVPGLAQAKLGRTTGLLFVTVEAIALTMYGKASRDLSLARRLGRDSTPLTFVIDQATGLPARDENGALQVATWSPSQFPAGLIHARRTHVEDWVAVLLFNHLFAGIDGYVAAQLWELPTQVQMRASPGGRFSIRANVKW
jgi:hypothetical protein